jgi:hypothetical protein
VDAVLKSYGLGPLRQGLRGIGIGSLPLANVSTPWLAGEDCKFLSPLPGAEPLTAGKPMMTRQSSNLLSDVEKESIGGSEYPDKELELEANLTLRITLTSKLEMEFAAHQTSPIKQLSDGLQNQYVPSSSHPVLS